MIHRAYNVDHTYAGCEFCQNWSLVCTMELGTDNLSTNRHRYRHFLKKLFWFRVKGTQKRKFQKLKLVFYSHITLSLYPSIRVCEKVKKKYVDKEMLL